MNGPTGHLAGYLLAPSSLAARVAAARMGWRHVDKGLWLRQDGGTVQFIPNYATATTIERPGIIYVVDDDLEPLVRIALERQGHRLEDIALLPEGHSAGRSHYLTR